jgi:hypothetical protein
MSLGYKAEYVQERVAQYVQIVLINTAVIIAAEASRVPCYHTFTIADVAAKSLFKYVHISR